MSQQIVNRYLADRQNAEKPKVKFNARFLNGLKPDPVGGRYIVRCSDPKGLQVEVQPSGTLSCRIVGRIKNKDVEKKVVKLQIGTWTDFDRDIDKLLAKTFDIQRQLKEGNDPRPENRKRATAGAMTTLIDIFEQWYAQSKKDGAKKQYRPMVENHLKDWHNTPMRDVLDYSTLEQIRDSILKEENGEIVNKSAATQVLKILKRLTSYWHAKAGDKSELVLWPLSDSSVREEFFDGLESEPHRPHLEVVADETDDLKLFWAATGELPAFYADKTADGELLRDLFRFALLTGMRRREITHKLSWENIDWQRRTFEVHKTKNKSDLTLPMTAITEKLLRDRWESLDCPGDGLVFDVTETGRHTKTVEQIIEKMGRSVEITMHTLRRSFVGACYYCMLPEVVTKSLMNHKKPRGNVTHTYYQTTPAALRAPLEKVHQHILASV